MGRTFRTIWVCGCGHDGRLGLGNEENRNVFVPVQLPAECGDVVSIHVGGFHNFVVCADGSVLGWGANDEGQLGIGERTPAVRKPRPVPFLSPPQTKAGQLYGIFCGAHHTVAWRADGLYSCGSNTHGQLGHGDTESRNSFTHITSLGAPPFSGDAVAGGNGADSRSFITHVGCGTFHTVVALRDIVLPSPPQPAADDGAASSAQPTLQQHLRFFPAALAACGRGDYGELGFDPDPWDVMAAQERRIKRQVEQRAARDAMAAGGPAAAAEGAGDDNAISDFPPGVIFKPKVVFKTAAKKRRPEFFRMSLTPVVFPLLREASLAVDESAAVPSASHLLTARAATSSSAVPEICSVHAMHLHTAVAIAVPSGSAPRLYQFGCNYCNEIEGLETSRPAPVPLPGARQLHAADEALYCVVDDDVAATAGDDGRSRLLVRGKGNLGLGDTDSFTRDFVDVPLPAGVRRVEKLAGRSHIVALVDGGAAVVSWGDNLMGQLGHGSTDDSAVATPARAFGAGDCGSAPGRRVRRVLDVGCGNRHTVLLVEEEEADA